MTKLLIALAWILLGGIAAFVSFKGLDKMYEELYFKKLSPEEQKEILNKLENDTSSFEKMVIPRSGEKRNNRGSDSTCISIPDYFHCKELQWSLSYQIEQNHWAGMEQCTWMVFL